MLQKDSTACTSKFVSLFLWELLTERGINIHFDQEPLLSQQELPVQLSHKLIKPADGVN